MDISLYMVSVHNVPKILSLMVVNNVIQETKTIVYYVHQDFINIMMVLVLEMENYHQKRKMKVMELTQMEQTMTTTLTHQIIKQIQQMINQMRIKLKGM